MAFQFSLAGVLRYRQSQEERERLALQRLHTRRAALLRELHEIREASLQLQRSLRRHLQQALIPAVAVQVCGDMTNRLERRQQQLRAALLQLQSEVAVQTERYKQARQKREVLDSLCERQLNEYRRHQQRREQAAVDELFLLRRNLWRA